MRDAFNILVLVASAALLVAVAGFVLKGYWLLFMLGWGAIWPR